MSHYDRAPSPALRALLEESELLAPLLVRRSVLGRALDVHFRGDEVHVYCGAARLLVAGPAKGPAKGGVSVSADGSYMAQPCAAGLFLRSWAGGDGGFAHALEAYYAGVALPPHLTGGEGAVQAAWASIRDHWIPFDREVGLKYASTAARAASHAFPAVDTAREEIARIQRTEGWDAPKERNVGARTKVDQLAIDPEGRLVIIELKDAAADSAASIFYAPLQLLEYVHEWAGAFESVRPSIDALRKARIELGLELRTLSPLTGELRPVVGFGPEILTAEVLARFNRVLSVVNRHLPPGALPIEAWAMRDEGLVQLR